MCDEKQQRREVMILQYTTDQYCAAVKNNWEKNSFSLFCETFFFFFANIERLATQEDTEMHFAHFWGRNEKRQKNRYQKTNESRRTDDWMTVEVGSCSGQTEGQTLQKLFGIYYFLPHQIMWEVAGCSSTQATVFYDLGLMTELWMRNTAKHIQCFCVKRKNTDVDS